MAVARGAFPFGGLAAVGLPVRPFFLRDVQHLGGLSEWMVASNLRTRTDMPVQEIVDFVVKGNVPALQVVEKTGWRGGAG